MNARGGDSGLCDERRGRSLKAIHAKLSGFKVGGAAELSYATPAVLRNISWYRWSILPRKEECQMRYIHKGGGGINKETPPCAQTALSNTVHGAVRL